MDNIAPTYGFVIHTLPYNGLMVNIWDIGGQKTIRSFWRNYFERTDGVVWVVDSSAPDRLGLCREELHGVMQEDRLQTASLLILANKQDVPGAASVADIKAMLGWSYLETRCHCEILPCSALENRNIGEGLQWIVSDIAARHSYPLIPHSQ